MATAIYHGKTSQVWFQIANGSLTQMTGVRSWSYTLNVSVADTTAMAATTGRTRVVGIKSGTVTIEAVYDGTKYVELEESDNDVYSEGATGIGLQLLRDATDASKGIKSGAMCTGVSIGVGIDDTPIITYNFILIGTITADVTAGTPP